MIFDKLNHLLSPIANAVLAFIAFLQAHQLALALLSGVMLPFIFSAKHGGQEKPTFLQRILILLSMICFVFGSIAPVAVWFLQRIYGREDIASPPLLTWTMALLFTVAGFILHVVLRRLISPEFDKVKCGMVKKNQHGARPQNRRSPGKRNFTRHHRIRSDGLHRSE